MPSTFKQRVFTYDKYWNKETGAIWFYCGKEANVELYINATGLMWENAKAAGALLVFAEGLELRVTTIRGRGTTKGEGRC